MSSSEDRLRALLERRGERLAENAGELREWTESLARLWERIGGWLRPLVDDGILRWEVRVRPVEGDDCEPYLAPFADATDPAEIWRVGFAPFARHVVGDCTGRVNVEHGPMEHHLLRFGTGADEEWRFRHGRDFRTDRRSMAGDPLTREHVLDVLADALEPWVGPERADG